MPLTWMRLRASTPVRSRKPRSRRGSGAGLFLAGPGLGPATLLRLGNPPPRIGAELALLAHLGRSRRGRRRACDGGDGATIAPRADVRNVRACDSSSCNRWRVVAISCSSPCRAHVSSSRLPPIPVLVDLRVFAMTSAPGGWNRERRTSIARFLVLALTFVGINVMTIRAQEASFDAALGHAYAAAYNLDHDEAVRELTALAKLKPDLPTTYRALASITWLRLLFSRGTVLVDEYLGRISKRDVQMAPPPPDMAADFSRYLSAAISRAEAQAMRHPRDGRALYDLSSALGLQASWSATVEGRMGRAFGAARRAYKTAEQASAVSPDDPDPRLILGTYRYVVSGMNLPTRMVAYMAGLDGDRARGLQMVEQAASSASPVRTEARFALILLYNRERRWDDALDVLAALRDAVSAQSVAVARDRRHRLARRPRRRCLAMARRRARDDGPRHATAHVRRGRPLAPEASHGTAPPGSPRGGPAGTDRRPCGAAGPRLGPGPHATSSSAKCHSRSATANRPGGRRPRRCRCSNEATTRRAYGWRAVCSNAPLADNVSLFRWRFDAGSRSSSACSWCWCSASSRSRGVAPTWCTNRCRCASRPRSATTSERRPRS